MLPSKFFDPPVSNEDKDGPGSSSQVQAPPLGMTGVMCKIGKVDMPGRGTIHYRIFRPRQVEQKPPLVVLHGGPLIPCNYLLPLAYVVVDRALIFYDQLGCGQSSHVSSPSVLIKSNNNSGESEKGESTNTSSPILDVDAMVQDLDRLLDHWNFSKFHLLGHSFGGILAFEYLKYCQLHNSPEKRDRCQSVILASAPTSAQIVEEEVQRLVQDLNLSGESNADDGDDNKVGALPKNVPKEFREKHECRMTPIPFPLMDSYNQAGPLNLRGLQSIGNYTASLAVPKDKAEELGRQKDSSASTVTSTGRLRPPLLVLRGQHDFITDACVKGWDDLFKDRSYMTLAGCSHYGMLENEVMYGSVVTSFLTECDEPCP